MFKINIGPPIPRRRLFRRGQIIKAECLNNVTGMLLKYSRPVDIKVSNDLYTGHQAAEFTWDGNMPNIKVVLYDNDYIYGHEEKCRDSYINANNKIYNMLRFKRDDILSIKPE